MTLLVKARLSSAWATFLSGFAASLILVNSAGANQPLPSKAPYPDDNPPTKAKISLGKMLYFDPRLSHDGTISCNSCHNVMGAGEDGRSVSVGVKGQKGGRSAPTVFNAAFLSVQFWDGRAATLEDQAKGPLTNPIEMGMKDHDSVIARLKKIPGYKRPYLLGEISHSQHRIFTMEKLRPWMKQFV